MTVTPPVRADVLTPPSSSEGWTTGDLEKTPDDGYRYQLFDGTLVVSPTAQPRHQIVVRSLFLKLHSACPAELLTFPVPLGYQPDDANSAEPDLLVVRPGDIGEKNVTRLVLAVEVLSPSTRRVDLLLKHSLYERTGVEHYWVVDPDGPEFVAFELEGERYRVAATARGDERVELSSPFPVTICPAELLDY